MNKILFVDTLTTGLHNERCAIYRIGGIFCEETAEKIIEKERFEIFVRPFDGARIIDNSLWIGGATRSQLIYYPEQSVAFNDFYTLIQKYVNVRNSKDKIYIAGFSASSFDVAFIKNWFLKNNNQHFRDCFYLQTLDIMSLSAFALLNERNGMPDFHLETAARFLGVVNKKSQTYNCLDNAETCLELYKKLKTRLSIGDGSKHEKTEAYYTNFKGR